MKKMKIFLKICALSASNSTILLSQTNPLERQQGCSILNKMFITVQVVIIKAVLI